MKNYLLLLIIFSFFSCESNYTFVEDSEDLNTVSSIKEQQPSSYFQERNIGSFISLNKETYQYELTITEDQIHTLGISKEIFRQAQKELSEANMVIIKQIMEATSPIEIVDGAISFSVQKNSQTRCDFHSDPDFDDEDPVLKKNGVITTYGSMMDYDVYVSRCYDDKRIRFQCISFAAIVPIVTFGTSSYFLK